MRKIGRSSFIGSASSQQLQITGRRIALASAHQQQLQQPSTLIPPLLPELRREPIVKPAVHNFSPGPAQLPRSVLSRARDEFLSWPETPGMSVMCVSHREHGGPYQQLQARAELQVRVALDVPDDYHVLFMQGGAHAQFAALPLNLCGGGAMASGAGAPGGSSHSSSQSSLPIAAVDSGFWSRRAASEFSKYAAVHWAASAELSDAPSGDAIASGDALTSGRGGGDASRDWRDLGRHTRLPCAASWNVPGKAAFVHVCANETINGLELHEDPSLAAGAPPVVADFTSTLLSRPVDISKYGVVYASGGKNIGPAGVTLVIVRDSLLRAEREHPLCPSMLSYRTFADTRPITSLHATPPTFAIYLLSLTLEELAARGGVQWAAERSTRLAALLYSAIDASCGFYTNSVHAASRSRVSVPFAVRGGSSRSPAQSKALEQSFLHEAEARGFRHIAGHPLVGGLRASVYNGVADEAVEALVGFMDDFRRRHA